MSRKMLTGFGHALRGLHYVWREEFNFRVHCAFAIVVACITIGLKFSLIESIFIVFAIVLVLGSEILNTIVEDILDELHPQHHKVIGRVKDMMAAIVLVNAVAAAVIGVLTFVHHFMVA